MKCDVVKGRLNAGQIITRQNDISSSQIFFEAGNRIETIEKSLGLDTGPVFLNVAVRTLLERPETVEAWLSGQKIFPGVSGNEVVDSANAVKTA